MDPLPPSFPFPPLKLATRLLFLKTMTPSHKKMTSPFFLPLRLRPDISSISLERRAISSLFPFFSLVYRRPRLTNVPFPLFPPLFSKTGGAANDRYSLTLFFPPPLNLSHIMRFFSFPFSGCARSGSRDSYIEHDPSPFFSTNRNAFERLSLLPPYSLLDGDSSLCAQEFFSSSSLERILASSYLLSPLIVRGGF